MTRKIDIFDTTLRDGEQSPGCSMNAQEKVIVARELVRMGVDVIEAGFPVSSPSDFRAVSEIGSVVGDKAVVAAFARAVDSDIDPAADALKTAARPRIVTGIGVSPVHMADKLHMSEEEVLARTSEAVAHAKTLVDDIEFYAEDAGRADVAFLVRVAQAAVEAGATVINVPDTTGACLPDDYAARVKAVVDAVDGRAKVSVHAHNDLGLATDLCGLRASPTQVVRVDAQPTGVRPCRKMPAGQVMDAVFGRHPELLP